MKYDLSRRFGFLASEIHRLYGAQFDILAREQIGLSLAQCRLLGALARHKEARALTQVELAQRLELSPMTVAGLCDRMEQAGWIARQASPTDRRAKEVSLQPNAVEALEAAIKLGDRLSAAVLAGLSVAEREQLLTLLDKARQGLLALPASTS
jgi:DNA-binding MarR family transcriptional regulator